MSAFGAALFSAGQAVVEIAPNFRPAKALKPTMIAGLLDAGGKAVST